MLSSLRVVGAGWELGSAHLRSSPGSMLLLQYSVLLQLLCVAARTARSHRRESLNPSTMWPCSMLLLVVMMFGVRARRLVMGVAIILRIMAGVVVTILVVPPLMVVVVVVPIVLILAMDV